MDLCRSHSCGQRIRHRPTRSTRPDSKTDRHEHLHLQENPQLARATSILDPLKRAKWAMLQYLASHRQRTATRRGSIAIFMANADELPPPQSRPGPD